MKMAHPEISNNRLRFEQLLAEVSAGFVKVGTENIDDAIEEALGQISDFLECDLATVLILDRERETYQVTHQWAGPGLKTDPGFRGLFIDHTYPLLSKRLAERSPFAIHSLEDWPNQAIKERQTCEQLGIKSVLWVPFCVGELLQGYLALNTTRNERRWSEEYLNRLELAGETFGNALLRHKDQQNLAELLAFEELVAKLSASLIQQPATEIDEAIQDGLRALGELMDVDRSFLNQFSTDQTSFRTTHMWSAHGLAEDERVFQKVNSEQLPWYTARMLGGQNLIFTRPQEVIPAEAADELEYVRRTGIRSSAMVPFSVSGFVIGNIGFDTIRSERTWSDQVLSRLSLVGQIFAGALVRQRGWQKMEKALEEIGALNKQLQAENLSLRENIELTHRHEEIIGDSGALRAILNQAERVADTDSTVMILGETGTGKELLAREIHRLSHRKKRPMVTVNCAALPPTLIEAELFGREKGAYTGALTRQQGRFEAAHNSTLFLDEIGELPPDVQIKLLRVLQDGLFERLGSNQTLRVDVRIIAATHCDLAQMVAEGVFREDLYYRLNVIPIEVPPLRERREDIPLLVWAFAQEFGQAMGKSIEQIPKRTMEVLKTYPWPGNIRELRNVIERAMILSQGPVLQVEMPRKKNGNPTGRQNLAEVEKQHIQRILKQTGGRIFGDNGAAEILGLKPTTLCSRMKKLGIQRTQ